MKANPFGWWDKFNGTFIPPERLADAERASDGGNEVVILNAQVLLDELRVRAGKYDESDWHSWVELAAANAIWELMQRFKNHTDAVGLFLNELYAISVDPCADVGLSLTVEEMKKALLEAAKRDRELHQQLRVLEVERDAALARIDELEEEARHV